MPRLEEIVHTHRLQRAAEGVARFEVNEFMERLIMMRATRPKSFAGLSSSALTSLAWYEVGKRRAQILATGNVRDD